MISHCDLKMDTYAHTVHTAYNMWFICTGSTNNTPNRRMESVEECEQNHQWMAVKSYSPSDSPGDRVTKRPPLFRMETQVLPPSIKSHTGYTWDQDSFMRMNRNHTY